MTLRELAESASSAVLRRVGRAYSRMQESTPLEADVLESDDTLVVVFDAPGVQSSDVQVRFVDDRLLVRIDRFRSFREGYEMRFPGRGLSLDGNVTIPEDVTVDPDAASATLTERGTLEIRLPKTDTETGGDEEAPTADSTDKSAAQTVEFDGDDDIEDTPDGADSNTTESPEKEDEQSDQPESEE